YEQIRMTEVNIYRISTGDSFIGHSQWTCPSRIAVYNGVMIETLYNTQTPEKNRSECYVLVLTSRVASGGTSYAFMQEHWHWNADLDRFIYRVNAIHAEEPLSYQHARGMYETAKHNLAQRGFVHSFASNGQRKEPHPDPAAQTESAMA